MTTDTQEMGRRARKVLVGLPLVALSVGVASTQFVAWKLGYDPALGPPVIAHAYWPWRFVQWTQAPWAPQPEGTFAMLRLGLTGAACLALLAWAKSIRKRPAKHPEIHGTARLATEAEIRASGLLLGKGPQQPAGIIVGGWTHKNGALSYLTHLGKTNVISFGPPRSGKTQGVLIPTLLTWPGSVIVYDPKGELYAQTAGWRRKEAGNTVMRLAPADLDNTISWNPFDRVRAGEYAFRDVANIIAQVADPSGKGPTDHWEPSAANFMVGIALFLLERRLPCSLSAILTAIDDSANPENLLNAMAACPQPQAASVGRGMLATEKRERGSIVSTARRQLTVYRDPVMARNTSKSAFAIDQLMNADRPVSLYIEARGEDELRMRPFVRLFLTIAVGQLISKPLLQVDGKEQPPHKHRLLLAVDEFASLGKMEPLEIALSKSSGFGITGLLLAQDYQQVAAAYGQHENITGNCQVMAAYAPNNSLSAKWLSDKTGQSTVVVEDVSETSQQGGGGKRSQNVTYRSTQRPVLTPDEVCRLKAPERDTEGRITAPGELLVFQAGQHVIRATQSLAFRDPEFQRRMAIPALTTDTEILQNAPPAAPGNAVLPPRRWRLQ